MKRILGGTLDSDLSRIAAVVARLFLASPPKKNEGGRLADHPLGGLRGGSHAAGDSGQSVGAGQGGMGTRRHEVSHLAFWTSQWPLP